MTFLKLSTVLFAAQLLTVNATLVESAPRSCMGFFVTISGTPEDDLLIGTQQNDVIRAGKGADTVLASDGNDIVCGGRGNDLIHGGNGFDRVRGGRGDDQCIQSERTRNCERG